MPELPEVEGVVQDLLTASPPIVGLTVEQVLISDATVVAGCTAAELTLLLSGKRIVSLSRHGKYLLFGLEDLRISADPALFLVVHLRMTGRLHLVDEADRAGRFTRILFLLDRRRALRFDDPRKFGKIWVVRDPAEVIDRLGPDALTVTYGDFAVRLKRYRRQLKPLLLDQSFLAGIGNIYADEILFRSGIHPLKNSGELAESDVRRLHQAMIDVLRDAVAHDGANIDGTFKAGRFQVKVYGRGGMPCPVCGHTLVRCLVGQRGTCYCPTCQA